MLSKINDDAMKTITAFNRDDFRKWLVGNHDKEDKVLHGELTTKSLPLSKETPISITIHKIGDNFIVDPTTEEEDLSEARVTIGSHDGIIHSMQKGEEKSIKIEDFGKILDLSEKVYKDIFKKIEKSLK